MEEQAAALYATLRKSSAPVESKIAAFNKLKSDIKHLRVPEAAQPTIFDCVRVAISAQASPTLVSTGFSTFGHLVKRLSLQEQTGIIAAQAPRFLPIFLERLGDAKESHRNAASQCLAEIWAFSHVEVEKAVRDVAISGNNARAKEMGMMWVVKMNREQGLQFRGFVPNLVASLEDADGGVRETAKSVVVELFRNAPDHAKTDLKKQMAAHDVRKTISSFVISHLDMGSTEADMASSTISVPAAMPSRRAEPHIPEPVALTESVMTEHSQQEGTQVEPFYVHTQRELEDIFRDMHPHFEGKESEHNWMPRDKGITKLRRLLAGNAPTEFHSAFVLGIKGAMDGILRVSNSLRTTHSSNGCQLVRELASVLGPAMDSLAEIVLQVFIKMSANTKPIAANNGDSTVTAILSNVSYNKRLMEHMWLSIQDKNVQTRSFAGGWLKTLIKKHSRSKAQIEHSGGLELIEKFLRKGLADANPKVRESTRATYWAFAQVWPGPAETMIESLDPKSKSLLEKDPNNPNSSSMTSSVSSIASAKSKPAAFNGRQSVRDAIAAQKKAMAAKLERPTSAASVLSVASNPTESTSSRPAMSRSGMRTGTSSLASKASTPNLGGQASGSLMAAPVRRPRRPEVSRPATADPYAASRRNAAQVTPTMSPANSPSKAKVATTTKSTSRTPAPVRPTTPAAQSTVRSKSRAGTTGLPRPSPKSKTGAAASPMSASREDRSAPTNIPFTQPPDDDQAYAAPPQRRRPDHSASESTSHSIGDDDNFTMVGISSLANYRSQAFDSRPGSSGRPSSSGSSHLPLSTGLKSSPSKLGLDGKMNSPMQRLRNSVPPRSPQTPGSQSRRMDVDTAMEQVHIYEDPMTPDKPQETEEQPQKPVLEELPLNERAPDRASSEQFDTNELSQSTRSNEQNIEVQRTPRSVRSHHKTTSTGSVIGMTDTPGTMQASAEVFRSRRLLASGIERIRSRTLDAHGFRRVQEIIKSREDIWGDDGQKYGEFLIALLDHLESPSKDSAAKSSSPNLKIQILATIRAMLTLYKPLAAPYYSRALCSVLYARRQFDDSSHITSDIEKTAAEIVAQGQPSDCLNAVLDLVESLSAPTSPTSNSSGSSADFPPAPSTTASTPPSSNVRTITLSLTTLSHLLQASAAKASRSQSASSPHPIINPSQEKRLGALAARCLQDTDPDVRKADLEFCLVAHEVLGREAFWRSLVGAKEASLNLVTYYLARRGRG